MTVETLEPGLTKSDLRVLRAIPAADLVALASDPAASLTIWQIAEALDTEDMADLRRTLDGLHHLDYVHRARSRSRRRHVWYRSSKGDEAVSR